MLFSAEYAHDRNSELDLNALMDEYGTELLRLCNMYLKDYQLAQDVVQETFLKVYMKYDSFEGRCGIKTWITSIAMNVCRDAMRKRSYKERPMLLPSEEKEQNAYAERAIKNEAPTPEAETVDTETRITVMNAVTSLPDIYRQAILLYYYGGFSAEEIAGIVKCAKATVNIRLMRGRRMLKDVLSEV